ncbi:hypothetical protein K8Q98_01315 [Candidatus Nomurabacteria bacterium]|nr:hypothetical protein [Candidatus Nomurabacteria bacterium]
MLYAGKMKSKGRHLILPSINALLIVGLALYFYGGEVPGNVLLLFGVLLAITQDALIKWFTESVSEKEHIIVLSVVSLVWVGVLIREYINFNKNKQSWEELKIQSLF